MIYFCGNHFIDRKPVEIRSQSDEYLGKIYYHEDSENIRLQTAGDSIVLLTEDVLKILEKMRGIADDLKAEKGGGKV